MTEEEAVRPDEDYDPPLRECPPWCQEPPNHPWEDEWSQGPVRVHRWMEDLDKYDGIGVESMEQHTGVTTIYHTEILLDVQSPTRWDIDSAARARLLIAEAIDHAVRWRKAVGEHEVQ